MNKTIPEKYGLSRVYVEDGPDSAGQRFALEIIKALQFWREEGEICLVMCAGASPVIGYRKFAGDAKAKAGIGSIMDNWRKPAVRELLVKNKIDPELKPDMNKVTVFALDAFFPQKRNDYCAFSNLLNKVCGLWGIPASNRNFFYGDVYVEKTAGTWSVKRIPDKEYNDILMSVRSEGLKLLEYQAACLVSGEHRGFGLNSGFCIKGDKVTGPCRVKNKYGFSVRNRRVIPLSPGHVQYRYLEGMRNQAIMMSGRIFRLGGPRVTLLGVGPSSSGRGHIGFCESGTLPEQDCFISPVNDFAPGFHISAGHAKEFYGFKKMFVTRDDVRKPELGFISFGPKEMLGASKPERTIVIVIATGKTKSRSVKRAVEGGYDLIYPLSLTRKNPRVFVLDESAGGDLKPGRGFPRGKNNSPLPEIIRPREIEYKLRSLGVNKKDRVLLVNPHPDDDFLSMPGVLSRLGRDYVLYPVYLTPGYTAVYSDYVLDLLGEAEKFTAREFRSLLPDRKKALISELAGGTPGTDKIIDGDYEIFPYLNNKEKSIRAKVLMIDLNERVRSLTGKCFDSRHRVCELREFLCRVEEKKSPGGGNRDLEIMRYLKTSIRFMEAASALVWSGAMYENVFWPLKLSFYGELTRSLPVTPADIEKVKKIINALKPKMVVFNGEGFFDFGAHSNTELAVYFSLYGLLEEKKISPDTLMFQWAGVWDRLLPGQDMLSVILNKPELSGFSRKFGYFYPSQAPYPAVPKASNEEIQSFARDVINAALSSGRELSRVMPIPQSQKKTIDTGGGVLNYKLIRLGDKEVRDMILAKRNKYLCVRKSRGARDLIGPVPYPENLSRIPRGLVRNNLSMGAVTPGEEKLFGLKNRKGKI